MTIDDVCCSCIENCGDIRSLSEPLILEAVCTGNCVTRFGDVEYQWRLYNLSDRHIETPLSLLNNTSLTGMCERDGWMDMEPIYHILNSRHIVSKIDGIIF